MAVILVHAGKKGLNPASIARMKKGLKVREKLRDKGVPSDLIIFILPSGDAEDGGLSQSDLMKSWLVLNGAPPNQVVSFARAHNTWQEINSSYQMVVDLKFPQPVYHVSNWNHIWPRIWLIAKFWGRILGVKSKFATTGLMNRHDSIREVGANGKAIYMMAKNFKAFLRPTSYNQH